MKTTVPAVLIINAFIVPAWADTETQTAELVAVTVTGDRQGMKIQTNVVTMHEMDESTETDLRGLLEKSLPSISAAATVHRNF